MIDPFAKAPVEDTPPWEKQTPEQPAEKPQEAPVTASTPGQPIVVNTGSEGKLVATFKGGKGYDAPWLVVHANNITELDELISDWDVFGSVLEKVKKIGAAFAAEDGAPAPKASFKTSTNNPAPKGEAGRPAGANQSPDGVVLTCQHGDRVYRNKVEYGKVKWEAQFCPTPKGTPDQCEAIFKDKNKGWES